MEKGRKTYEDGLREAWETARRIAYYDDDDPNAITDEKLEEIFGTDDEKSIFVNYTAQEAAAKIAEWENNQEIRFCDEVIYGGDDNMCGVVTKENLIDNNDKCCVLWSNGEVGWPSKSNLTKTGRTIDIAGLLAQIGGANGV